jgi:hypothetical protein
MKKVLRFTILLVTCYLLLITFAQSANAHVLKSDGSIGAVMHIDPADDPIAGEISTFFFEWKDTKRRFRPENCDCTFLVFEDGKQIYSQTLESQDNTLSGTFTFPRKNIYKIQIAGTPTASNAFDAFTLTYDIRVEKERIDTSSTKEVPLLFATRAYWGLLFGVVFLAGLFFSQKHE